MLPWLAWTDYAGQAGLDLQTAGIRGMGHHRLDNYLTAGYMDVMRACNSVRLEHDLRMVKIKLEAALGDKQKLTNWCMFYK